MKKSFKIIMLGAALFVVQACGPKSKEKALEGDSTNVTAPDAVSAEQAKENKRAERIRMREEKQKALEAKWAAESESYKDEKGVIIYARPEAKAEYPGGDEGMRKYLKDNLKYPASETDEWEGTVFVDFVVDPSGKVMDAKVVDETEGSGQAFRDEALRVVNGMPAWVPGRHKGKPVYVHYNLPITFEIL